MTITGYSEQSHHQDKHAHLGDEHGHLGDEYDHYQDKHAHQMSMITNIVIFSRPIRSIKTLPEGEEEDSKRGTKQITSVNTAADIL